MESHYTITDGGSLVVDVMITDDGKVIVTTAGTQVKAGEEVDVAGASAAGAGAAQYVWGATNVGERASATPSARLEISGDYSRQQELRPDERRLDSDILSS